VALVTGASRGVGRGIALGLGEAGATVYVGGRTLVEGTAASLMPGTIVSTARQVDELGGTGIPLRVDVNDDEQIAAAVARIEAEQGRLDVLVNSAWGGYERFTDGSFTPGPFWEQPLSLWDSMHRVGVRAHYLASALAAPLMIRSGHGLIVSLSSFAGRMFVPPVAYGVAHAAIDRLARDMAEELRPHQVASVSLYPGLVLTESVLANIQYFEHETNRETPLFVGRTVAALAADDNVIRLTGRRLVAAEVAAAYGVTDEHGHLPHSNRPAILGEPVPPFEAADASVEAADASVEGADASVEGADASDVDAERRQD
jgi:NAD(P)-dependent dehydrogenase (short-subunit alcohol dehydrogenase family)